MEGRAKYYAFRTRDYMCVTGLDAPLDVRRMLNSIRTGGPPEPAGYGQVRDLLASAVQGSMYAVLRKSGQFSLISHIPSEDELDRMLATTEDEMHVWSAPPSDRPPDGTGASVVAAAIAQFLKAGGTKETLHARVDVAEV